ncbi:molybdopterin-binding protein [Streptomyces varsoviensis]|uniref:molybdopterin-binding protein n=1 Tax=Streptomyces varsoviensis TaxID=67373 RepID=UPI0033C94DE3
MNGREADAALDRAAAEALALLSDVPSERSEQSVRGERSEQSGRDERSGRGERGGPDTPAPAHGGRAAREDRDVQAGTGGAAREDGRAGGADSRSGSGERTDDGGPHANIAWDDARTRAERAVRVLEPVVKKLPDALGHVLAEPLAALTDLPPFDTSAMDGWTVAGPGPWRIAPDGPGILAGHARSAALPDGRAVRIATGARVPPGATAVLRSEHGTVSDPGAPGAAAWLHADRAVTTGQDIRPRGQECRSGDQLLPARTYVTPAVLGLAAAAGYDALRVVPRPRVEVLVLGDELLDAGLPRDGRIRDALGPMLAPWLRSLGAEVIATRTLKDDYEALYEAVLASGADVIVTTGGTASGPVDHVRPMLRRVFAESLIDGVAVRPGHPMLLSHLVPNRHLIGLPGNPLAAVSGLLTLAGPLLRTLAGRVAPVPYRAPLTEAVHGHPEDTRLVPVAYQGDEVRPLRFHGPAMLRGIAAADALAVIPPGGLERGAVVETLDLPWVAGDDPNAVPAVSGSGDHSGGGSGDRSVSGAGDRSGGSGTAADVTPGTSSPGAPPRAATGGLTGPTHPIDAPGTSDALGLHDVPGLIDLADSSDLGASGEAHGEAHRTSSRLGAHGWQGVFDEPERQEAGGGTSRPGRSGAQIPPGSPGSPDAPGSPGSSDAPGSPDAPDAPDSPEGPDAPDSPGADDLRWAYEPEPREPSTARPSTAQPAAPSGGSAAPPAGPPTGRFAGHDTLNAPRRLDAPMPFGLDSGALS